MILVLVHGGWHCGESWAPVVPLLRSAGHSVVTPSLLGHGTDARFPAGYFTRDQPGLDEAPTTLDGITIGAAADALIETLREVRAARERSTPLVLVAHSSAGVVTSRAAELEPDLVDHLVYLAAIVPTRRASAAEVGALPEYGSPTMDGLVVGDPATVGALRLNPRSSDPAYRELLRRTFYGELSPERAAPFLELLTPDQPLAYIVEPTTLTAQRWGSIPRTYVITSQDRAIAPAVQEILIADADETFRQNPFRRVAIDTGHSPFAVRPDLLADALLDVPA